MSTLSRRQFFSFLAVKAAENAQTAVISMIKTTRALEPRQRGNAQCARCLRSFDPVGNEVLCSTCRDIEAKQQSLIDAVLLK